MTQVQTIRTRTLLMIVTHLKTPHFGTSDQIQGNFKITSLACTRALIVIWMVSQLNPLITISIWIIRLLIAQVSAKQCRTIMRVSTRWQAILLSLPLPRNLTTPYIQPNHLAITFFLSLRIQQYHHPPSACLMCNHQRLCHPQLFQSRVRNPRGHLNAAIALDYSLRREN